MLFTISRSELLRLLRAVSGVVDKRPANVPILSNVLIDVVDDKIIITSSDQEVQLIARGVVISCEQNLSLTVSFRKLSDIVKALPEDSEMCFEVDDNKLVIRSKKSKFVLSTMPYSDFPKIKIANEKKIFTVDKKELKKLIESTSFAMAEQDVRYYLNGMLFEIKNGELYTVAADGHRLALNKVKLDAEGSVKVIVPRKGVLELLRILDDNSGFVDVFLSGNHMLIKTCEVELATKLLDGKFPDYSRIIPSGGDKVVVGSRKVLKDAFLRTSALFSDKFRGINLRMSSLGMKILAINAEKDEVEDDVEVQYTGQELEIGFNVKYLLDFLGVIPDDKVKISFSSANSSALVVGESGQGGVYVLMPMRL